MKTTIKLLIVTCAVSFAACSSEHIVTNTPAHETVKASTLVGDLSGKHSDKLDAGSAIFDEVDKDVQDSTLKYVVQYIASHPERNFSTLANTRTSVKFIPVIEKVYSKEGVYYRKDRTHALCPSSDEKVYYWGEYKDRSKFTKDDNPGMYKANVDLFGQAFADEAVRRARAITWTISVYQPGGNIYPRIQYAKSHSDDGTFFILTVLSPWRNMDVCYFKDGKPFVCKKNDEGELYGRIIK